MRTCLECVPCIVNQAVEAPRRFTDDPAILEQILKETMAAIIDFDLSRTPPEMGNVLNQIMNRALGNPDPYYQEKRRFNALALELLPEFREMIDSAEDPFETAVRLAIAANFIDFGAPAGRTDDSLTSIFSEARRNQIKGRGRAAVADLKQEAKKAKNILYLADNAGEIVMDRLLIEQLPSTKVVVAVREGPAINDALIEDAAEAGLNEIATVVTSGAALPGTPLAVCSPEFCEHFRSADLIISKGQGNYETLSEEKANIFFLLVAKCRTVAKHLSCELGDFVVSNN
ncbi:MAG: DUF89 family protein [Proteobacteria bacterium]|nr:DUF89 family protein [Pseudomonadota bacterium]